MEKYRRAKELIENDSTVKSEEQFAEKYKIPLSKVQDMAATIRKIDENWDGAPMDEYARVSVGKLLVPRSFKKHCEMLSEMLNVRIEAVYQLLMMDAMTNYGEKYEAVVEAMNDGIVETAPKFDSIQKEHESSRVEVVPGQEIDFNKLREQMRGVDAEVVQEALDEADRS